MSRWLVGSSSSSRAGSETRALPRSTRRRPPPAPPAARREPPAVALFERVLQYAEPFERDGVPWRLGHAHRRVVIVGDERAKRAEAGGDLIEGEALPLAR